MKMFKIGRTTIYCSEENSDGVYHYTTDDKWQIYLRVRKETPHVVRIFNLYRDLKLELSNLDYYI